MALGVLNNISAVYAENNLNMTQANLQTTLQQLSSGSRINSGADDAAGLSIADGLAANSAALDQSSSNASAGVGFLQVADGALSQVTNLLNRAVTLATEAGGGTLDSAQLSAANQEYQDILTQIGTIGNTTEYNGIGIFNTAATGTAVTLTDAAKTVTSGAITSGDNLSGSITLTDATAGKSGTIDMSNYSGLTTASTEAATLASLNTALAATPLGALVTATYAGGVLTFTDSTNDLTHTGTMDEASATPTASSMDIYTSDGTSTGSFNYGVSVGILTDSSVGTSDTGSAAGTAISVTVGTSTGTGGTTAGDGVGTSLTGTQLDDQADSEAALQTVTNAISAVAYQRGQVGANINTLTAASNIASSEETNVQSAQNNITQTDYASATSNLSKYEILTQTGISALAQANSTEQMVTKLLQ
ncbi:MAG TPA: flagellin [Acidobacteriaceae bacterium]|nr:flagellin [Acidobacteriaceae bacterium]